MINIAQIRDKYTLICNRCYPDTYEGTLIRTKLVEWLENQTRNAFHNTSDFFEKMDKFLLKSECDGERLRTARLNKGWSQQILAAHLGVSRPFITQMERNEKPLILKALRFIRKIDDETPALPQKGYQVDADNKQVTDTKNGGQSLAEPSLVESPINWRCPGCHFTAAPDESRCPWCGTERWG